MPSTLAHLALQVPLSAGLFGRRVVPWAVLACVVPDVGWILQRGFKTVWWGGEAVFYDVRLLAVAMSSLLLSLVLCGVLASFAELPRRAFLWLAVGSVLHLLIDAVQLRWGNGVHLLPFAWRSWAPGAAPPDHVVFQVLSALGLLVLLGVSRRDLWVEGLRVTRRRLLYGALGLVVFLVAPILLSGSIEHADAHSLGTLRSPLRDGRPVELYRAHYYPADGENDAFLLTLISEPLRVASGLDLAAPARVSVKARFVGEDSLTIQAVHVHPNSRRSWFSVVGLLGIALLVVRWIAAARAAAVNPCFGEENELSRHR